MATPIFRKLLNLLLVAGCLALFTATASQAAIEFDVEAIEAEIAEAVALGADPVIAAKAAVANAVRTIISANPEYTGGEEALNADILEALAALEVTGLDTTDLLLAGSHGLGLELDGALEAYEAFAAANPRNLGPRIIGPAGASVQRRSFTSPEPPAFVPQSSSPT
jgi:hypothetical protein